jgi:hypothetical protein
MPSKKTLMTMAAAGGVFAVAALFLDVDVNLKEAWAEPAASSTVEWSRTQPYPIHDVYPGY